jgi:hypothetical protein
MLRRRDRDARRGALVTAMPVGIDLDGTQPRGDQHL